MDNKKHMLGHTLLRVTIGALFLIMGFNKFTNPDGIIGMLGGLGFPAATIFGYLLLLSEIIFGALLLVGYKVKITAWPIAIILFVAWLLVVLPNDGFMSPNSFFHLIGVFGCVTIALTGPGMYAISTVRS